MAVWFFMVWLVPALLLGALTYAEGASVGNRRWDLWRAAGLAACLVWPLTLPVLLVLARWHFRTTSRAARANIARRLGHGAVALAVMLTGWIVAMPLAKAVVIF